MTLDEVQPGQRIVCHSRGEIPGTVVELHDLPRPMALIDYGEGRMGFNWLDQISPLPAEEA